MQAIEEVRASQMSRGRLHESQIASGYDYSESAQEEESGNVFASGATVKLIASDKQKKKKGSCGCWRGFRYLF
jgi:hypothetical protein